MFDINKITRKNVLKMEPYSSARDEFKGIANTWLDANENPYKNQFNRYPDPLQIEIKNEIGKLKGLKKEQIFIGNGSDEAIDLLLRAFCEPQINKVYIYPPTYGMYEVSAAINNIEVVEIPLAEGFDLPALETYSAKLEAGGLVFICSPNNPTGNTLNQSKIKELMNAFEGIVVIDEAYIDFSFEDSAIKLLNEFPNLVVLQTFSKAWGMAGLRLGMAFANKDIISIMNKIKAPYNINSFSQAEVLKSIKSEDIVLSQIESIKKERNSLMTKLSKLNFVLDVYPSESNFILVRFENANEVFQKLLARGIVIRNKSSQIKGCLRISIGTEKENTNLINELKKINNEESIIYR